MNDRSANEQVVVKTAGSGDVSFQVYQDVYNTLTGKKEQLNRMLFDYHVIELSDYENLHHLMEQTIEQYDCKISHCSVSVRNSDGRTENFSSFEKFKLQVGNKRCATEDVVFEYEFLILLPKTNEPKTYTVTIATRSTLGVVLSHKLNNATEAEKRMFYDLETGTARYSIEYIDLAVARTLESQLDDWYKGLRKNGKRPRASFPGGVAEFVSLVVRVLGLVIVSVAVFLLLGDRINDVESLFKFGLVAYAVLATSNIVGIRTAFFIDKILRRLRPHSVVMLCQADFELEKSHQSDWLKAWGKTGIALIANVLLGLLTVYLGSKIGL